MFKRKKKDFVFRGTYWHEMEGNRLADRRFFFRLSLIVSVIVFVGWAVSS